MDQVNSDELLRIRIRDQLKAGKQKPKNRFWRVVNSPFFLWFLSSVLIAFAVAQYEEHKLAIAQTSKLAEKKASLRSEISYRLDTGLFRKLFEVQAADIEDGNKQVAQFGFPSTDLVNAICLPPNLHGEVALSQGKRSTADLFPGSSGNQLVANSGENRRQSYALLKGRIIYPEFKDRSIFSLLSELQNIETDQAQLQLLVPALSPLRSSEKRHSMTTKRRLLMSTLRTSTSC
ncbi:MAG: hypothetical protein OEN20_07235 [Gammaproteobacteria bacterium]|nr:hypothetical protein [Gammaproteobacteria bacterium]